MKKKNYLSSYLIENIRLSKTCFEFEINDGYSKA